MFERELPRISQNANDSKRNTTQSVELSEWDGHRAVKRSKINE